jgi:hypothetical protein
MASHDYAKDTLNPHSLERNLGKLERNLGKP